MPVFVTGDAHPQAPPPTAAVVTTEDLDPPVQDLDEEIGDVSSPEDRDRLLAATLAHVEAQDAQYRLVMEDERRPGRWKGPLALVVLALAGVIAVWPPAWLAGPAPRVPTQAELTTGARAALALQAEQVRVFQIRNNRLPRSLDELPFPPEGIRYVRSNNRVFQLVAPLPDGRALVYDAAQPGPAMVEARSFFEAPGS